MIRTMTEVAFAQSGDVSIAYRVVGDGPVDLVYVQGAFTHLDVYWELPAFRRYCERLAEFSRLVLFDKRGMGMSDRVPGGTPLDVRMDDIRAVMDAVGSESAVVMGESEGAPAGHALRGRAPGADAGADPPGRRGPRADRRRLAVGRGDRRAVRGQRRQDPGASGARARASRRGSRRSRTTRACPPSRRGGARPSGTPRRRRAGRRSPGWRSTSTSATSSRRSTSRP